MLTSRILFMAPSSSGLGRRPLTAVAWVRIPSGLQRFTSVPSGNSCGMLVNMKSATRMFVAGAAVTAVLAAPTAAVIWAEAAMGGANVTNSADPGHPGCTDVNGAPCGPGTASVGVPGANANAGQGNASASVPGANANAGPGYFNGCIPSWCWNAGG